MLMVLDLLNFLFMMIAAVGPVYITLASIEDYLYTNVNGGMWLVVQLQQGTTTQAKDGQVATISGTLQLIAYPNTPGSTYPIYHLNNQTALIHPQPLYQITNATVTQ